MGRHPEKGTRTTAVRRVRTRYRAAVFLKRLI